METILNPESTGHKVLEQLSDVEGSPNLIQESVEAQIFLDLVVEDYESESLEA